MFDLLKFALLAAGCIALYGIATGTDLNELFAEVTKQVVPVAKDVISGIWSLIQEAISKG
ncbi:hypothetical protein [Vibrio sp. 10N]|uniref:hypothetical protein n=1 Tax=Vibrio sp. 10N TaxID=3058938 RepID=UPI002814099C|nr:hypothetical protein VB10N_46860 [Vibrio sp. 10N]